MGGIYCLGEKLQKILSDKKELLFSRKRMLNLFVKY